MSGSHLAKHAAPTQQPARGRSREPEYEPDYEPAYNDYDPYPEPPRRGSGKWKIWLLVVILLVVVAALGYLVWQVFGGDIMDRVNGTTADAQADIAPGITTQIDAADGTGKNLSGNIAVTQGTQRPDVVPPEEDMVLLDINWTGKKDPEGPMYVTVSDPTWPDGDGLAVHHYNHDNAWETVGTYTIRDHSVTFMVNDLSPFAFQVISAEPSPSPSPEPTAEPTPTPVPTPEPTPAPITAMDYGMYSDVQNGVFTLAEKMEDDATYVIAFLQDMPGDEAGEASDEAEPTAVPTDSPDGEDGVDFSFVETAEGGDDAETAGEAAPAPEQTPGPVARVLLNLDGTNMRTVDMPLVKTDDGQWCLGGAVTAGMLWTTDGEYYASNTRYSMENNGSFLNLDDNNENVILTDSGYRTRWLIQTAELSDGSGMDTLDYYTDGERHYITAMEMLPDEVNEADFPAGTAPEEGVPAPAYLGGAAPETQPTQREVLHFTVAGEDNTDDALLVLLFKLDKDIETAPEGAGAPPASRIVVPAINADTDLTTMVIRDGANILTCGQDYTVTAQVYNNSTVVVTIRFIGKYTGQIVRTYAGTTFKAGQPEPSPSPSPEPSPSASPTPDGGGSTGNTGTETPTATPTPPQESPPAATTAPTATAQPTQPPTQPPASTPDPNSNSNANTPSGGGAASNSNSGG